MGPGGAARVVLLGRRCTVAGQAGALRLSRPPRRLVARPPRGHRHEPRGRFQLVCLRGRQAHHGCLARRQEAARLLLAGTLVSLAPLYILYLIAFLVGQQMEQFFPPWLFLTAYVTLCFLPLTLAYVIVVQRAMDVRVVVRQGLQYALARGGILVLRFAIAAVLFYVVYSLV